MNLLLLLSALLSALTGGSSVVREPAAAHAARSAVAAVADLATVARHETSRPGQTAETLVAAARRPVSVVYALAPTAPLYASRRRE